MYIIARKSCQYPPQTGQKSKISTERNRDAKFLIFLLKLLLSKLEIPEKRPPRPVPPPAGGSSAPGMALKFLAKILSPLFQKIFLQTRKRSPDSNCPGRTGSYHYCVPLRRSGHRPVLLRGISRGVYSIRVMLTGASAPPSLSRARIFPISRSTESRAFWRV